jgi:hypothetical protein
MLVGMKTLGAWFLLALLAVVCSASGAIAGDGVWHVAKASGEVWVTNLGVQVATVTADTVLKPGDNIRTGNNGRVLLVRGEETMLISPNSAIGIPEQTSDGMSTTITQQAGSILLEVERRNVKHFEVETPYLAAVVKGTHFRVTVAKNDTHVDVLRGEVEVSAFKSGQVALVDAGQSANVPTDGSSLLSLSGSGTFNPIAQGAPRSSSVQPLSIPAAGLAAPGSAANTEQTQMASLQGEGKALMAPPAAAAPAPVSLRGEGASQTTWMSRLFSTGGNSGGGATSWSRNDGLTFAMMFPLGIGILVAGAVAAQRRWQRRKAQ